MHEHANIYIVHSRPLPRGACVEKRQLTALRKRWLLLLVGSEPTLYIAPWVMPRGPQSDLHMKSSYSLGPRHRGGYGGVLQWFCNCDMLSCSRHTVVGARCLGRAVT